MDTNTLLARLRAAAAQYAEANPPVAGEARPWSSGRQVGLRQALLDSLARDAAPDVGRYLVIDDADFIDLVYLSNCGRSPDSAGRSHYLDALQRGTPRLELLSQVAGSDEALTHRGPPAWPLWLRALLFGLRLPSAFGRRATRAVMRRLERRLGRRRSCTFERMLWSLAAKADGQACADQRELRDLRHSVDTALTRANELEAALSERMLTLEGQCEAVEQRMARLASQAAFDSAAVSNALVALRTRIAALDYVGMRATPNPEATTEEIVGATETMASGRPTAAAGSAPYRATRPAIDTVDSEVTRYYITLQSVFRGDPERIRMQMEKDYLQLLLDARARAGDGPCVDLGTGRGEWLDVLGSHGFVATGVDANPFMAAAARERGQEVIDGDALAYLRSLPDDSVLSVTAFHLIEHLPFPVLFHVISECRRVLKPEGILILETPNPENILVATHTFHHDPTHGQPLTPSSVEFLVNHHGLQTVHLLRLHPYPDAARLPGNDPASERLNGMTCCGQDYAIVAKKVKSE